MTVVAPTGQADLVVPATVPVADLLPDLARSVGALDASRVHEDLRLATREGRELVATAGLSGQGVEDGALLVLSTAADPPAPPNHDDVVEAVVEAVESRTVRWPPGSARRAVLVVSSLALALGAATLLASGGRSATGVAVGAALGLVTAAGLHGRTRDEQATTVVLGWAGAGYAAVAGVLLAPSGPPVGVPGTAAAAGALTAALLVLAGVRHRHPALLPPLLAGLVVVVPGLVAPWARAGPGAALTATLVLVVLAGGALPRLALALSGARLLALGDLTDRDGGAAGGDDDAVDPDVVAAEALRAHRLLVALAAGAGLVLVALAPVAVTRGPAGTTVAVLCCLVVLLRARRHRVADEVLAGLLAGVAGLGSVSVAVVWSHPDWGPGLALVAVSVGVVVLVPPTTALRRRRLADLAETAALVLLPPLLLVATGVVDAARG